MNKSLMRVLVLCVGLCAAVVIGRWVIADGGGDEGGDCQGGDVQGTEDLELVVRLTPSDIAPSNVTGTAHLEVEDEDSNTTARLELEVAGLNPGTYTVNVSTNADTPDIVLGWFEFTASSEGGDDQGGDDTNIVSWGSEGDGAYRDENADENGDSEEIAFGSDSQFPFPDGLNPMALLSLSITDTNGNAVLSGDFTNLSLTVTNDFDAEVDCQAGSADPGATGTASLHSTLKHHRLKAKFALSVQGLRPKSRYTLVLNGVSVRTLHSNARGALKARGLPHGMRARSLVSVRLLDKNGAVAVFAHF